MTTLIVVDTSAVVAILFNEPMAQALIACLNRDPDRVMSAASYIEAGTVLAGRRSSNRWRAIEHLDEFLDTADIRLEPVDLVQMRIAMRARIRFGRGMGEGGTLNFGDTFPYALAMSRNAPLLFIGNDFRATDVAVALGSDPV